MFPGDETAHVLGLQPRSNSTVCTFMHYSRRKPNKFYEPPSTSISSLVGGREPQHAAPRNSVCSSAFVCPTLHMSSRRADKLLSRVVAIGGKAYATSTTAGIHSTDITSRTIRARIAVLQSRTLCILTTEASCARS